MNASFLRAAAAGVFLLGASGIAQAADLSRGERTYVAAQATPLYNWTGIYLGAHLGGRWGYDAVSLPGFGTDLDGSTVFGGLQIGYNFQTGPWVLGLEADAGYGKISKSLTIGPYGLTSERNWAGTVRARAGYAFDNLLVYGTGGLAWANLKSRLDDTILLVTTTNDRTRIGWTVGGGLEYGLTRNVSIKGEYLYADYGRQNTGAASEKITDHTVRVGLNYRF